MHLALLLLGFLAIPRIDGSLVLGASASVGPAQDVSATITATGSCLARGRPWTYRFCCEGACPPGVDGDDGEGIYTGLVPVGTVSVEIENACDFVDVGVHTARAFIGCWVAPEVELLDTLEVTAP